MKVGILKLGARVSFSSQGTSGATGEALSIINMVKMGGAIPVVFTKILDKDQNPEDVVFRNISDNFNNTTDIDCLIVINGSIQFYGGAEDPEQIKNYVMINKFKGPVFYIYCDPELTLKQTWPSIEKKPWASNWIESDINITRNDITYLCQPFNTSFIKSDFKKAEIIPKDVIHFPFEQFPCLNEQLAFNKNPEVDLSYGGTMRGGKRVKKMIKFYFGHPDDISVEMFGKIKHEDFDTKLVGTLRYPTFTGPVKYDQMLPKMNKALAHVVIGDPYYEKISDMSQRCFEAIQSNVVTFIDSDMDKEKRVYGTDKVLSDFLYVSSRQELSEKIQLLKADLQLREQIVADQLAAVNFNSSKYCTSFVNLLSKI